VPFTITAASNSTSAPLFPDHNKLHHLPSGFKGGQCAEELITFPLDLFVVSCASDEKKM